jgi:UDP-N-acetyl-D-galactosamine dehydrogenase
MIRRGGCNPGDTVVVLGLTFKEDCPDLRNSKVADLITNLKNFGLDVVVHDPLADPQEAMHEYGLSLTPWEQMPVNAKAVVMAVAHREYRAKPVEALLAPLGGVPGVFIDIKSVADRSAIERAGHVFWRL